ncbi:sulfate ABC transporter permease subunit [Gracilibacillus alcaliphilus]|uniref:sulfate ABC transporter permease subunit n=1 Tax=Gracilibacillus alcaliphilus TaxID=1401441 RepID=UPI00195ACFC1|nr:sulfate ABC transporter permease subunit [Gracilibacillus alcaliphilus]MBM7677898.1 sulfate transport system permease protein [Gracilibacillus alcaliphilus]
MRKLLISATWFLFILIIIFPISFIVTGAFEEGWSGFIEALTRPEALHAMKISLYIVVVVTIFNVGLGILFSLELVRGNWLARWVKPVINAIIDLPFAVSPVIGGFMIILLYGPETVLGIFFASFGVDIVFALPGMILATMFVTFPFVVREVVPVLEEIGEDVEEASRTLGASKWRTFRQVTWPSIQWPVVYGAVLTIARSLGEFGAVLVVSGNIINQTQTVTTLVYQDADYFNVVGANSLALILCLISIVTLLVLDGLKRRQEVLRSEHSSEGSV